MRPRRKETDWLVRFKEKFKAKGEWFRGVNRVGQMVLDGNFVDHRIHTISKGPYVVTVNSTA